MRASLNVAISSSSNPVEGDVRAPSRRTMAASRRGGLSIASFTTSHCIDQDAAEQETRQGLDRRVIRRTKVRTEEYV